MSANEQTSFDLLKQVDTERPTPESILLYLQALEAEMRAAEEECVSPGAFFSESALIDWYEVWSWRAECGPLPIHIDNLPIRLLLHRALTPFHCNATDMDVITMTDRVQRAKRILDMWLQSTGVETAELAEQAPQSKNRQSSNREAQKRFRLRQKAKRGEVSAETAQALEVTKAYEAYRGACKQRKDAMAQWDDYVESFRAAWQKLREQCPVTDE